MFRNCLVAGKAGSGKDSIGDWLVENYGYERVSFATPIKKYAPLLWPHLDWSKKQRDVLQRFGSLCRNVDLETWVRLAWMETETHNRNNRPVVITDCRYPNELDFFSLRGARVFRVEASYVTRVHRLMARDGEVDEELLKDVSETSLDGIKMDTLDNSGTIAHLFSSAKKLLDLP